MKNAKLLTHAAAMGLMTILLFVLCMFWKMTITDPVVDQFHSLSLKLLFPGFKGFDVASILWGMVLSFVYGFVASFLFHTLHPDCCPMKK
jgi:uncharacterized protein YggT (Ycf19 family)